MAEQQDNDPRGSEKSERAGWFATTHWSVVEAAQAGGSEPSLAALDALCRSYWYPLYAHVRRQGFPPAEAQDLTQGFFEQLIAKDFLKDVNPEKGRFRSFLLAALKHYLLNHRKYVGRQKRGGNQIIVSFDAEAAENRFIGEPAVEATVEQAFDRRWAIAVMELGLQRLREENRLAGKENLFLALKPFISADVAAGEYEALMAALGLTRNAIAVAVYRLRQRYAELIRAEVANSVAQPLDVEEETRYLLGLLAER